MEGQNNNNNSNNNNKDRDEPALIDKLLTGDLRLGAGLQYYKRLNHRHNSNCEDDEDDFCAECHFHHHHHTNGNGFGRRHVCAHHSTPEFGGETTNGTHTLSSLQPERSEIVQGIWNDDTHLHLFHIACRFVNAYKLYVWPHCVVNPAGLLQSNLKYLLCTAEGQAERSPLSLTMEVAICLGAFVEKSFDTSLQYWMKAKDTVSHLPKKVDYSLAVAVTAMAFHAELWEDNVERSKMYYEQAISICQKLGAYNSDAYIHSLYGLASISNTKEAVMKTLEELKRVKLLPYFCISNECGSLAKLLPFNITELKKINLIFNIIANISMGITIVKANAKEVGSGMVEYVVKFIKKLQTLEEELYYHPYSLWLTMGLKMMLYNLEADYLWGLNIRDVALKRAIKYLEESQKPEFSYLYSPAVKCEMILEIFFEMNEFDLLELQINCLKVDEDRCPGLKLLLLKYTGLLYQRRIERLEVQMKQLSSQAQLAQHSFTQAVVQPGPQEVIAVHPVSPVLQRPSAPPPSTLDMAWLPSPQQRFFLPEEVIQARNSLIDDTERNLLEQQNEQRQLRLKELMVQQAQWQESRNMHRIQKLQQRSRSLDQMGPAIERQYSLPERTSSCAASIPASASSLAVGDSVERDPALAFLNAELLNVVTTNGMTNGRGYHNNGSIAPSFVCEATPPVATGMMDGKYVCVSDFPIQFSPPEEFLRYGQKKRRTDSEGEVVEQPSNGGFYDGALSLEVVQPPVEDQRGIPCPSMETNHEANQGIDGTMTDATLYDGESRSLPDDNTREARSILDWRCQQFPVWMTPKCTLCGNWKPAIIPTR